MYLMPVAVTFRDVNYSDVLQDFSSEIEAGWRVLIVTAREEESTALTRLMAGFLMPERGSVVVLDNSTKETTQEKIMLTRRKLGIISFHGGLVSNLKMWENIFLPYYYHTGKSKPADDEFALNFLKRLNCDQKRKSLPAHLSLFEKRAAAFTRAAIMQPDIMIYCNTLDRISKQERTCLSSVMDEFHKEKTGRTSIYLTSATDPPVRSDFDAVLYIHPEKYTGTVT
jgi:ABC-type transporter Mla maintaining outer membrane lipid asymmetry ATPase subunit MlaF